MLERGDRVAAVAQVFGFCERFLGPGRIRVGDHCPGNDYLLLLCACGSLVTRPSDPVITDL